MLISLWRLSSRQQHTISAANIKKCEPCFIFNDWYLIHLGWLIEMVHYCSAFECRNLSSRNVSFFQQLAGQGPALLHKIIPHKHWPGNTTVPHSGQDSHDSHKFVQFYRHSYWQQLRDPALGASSCTVISLLTAKKFLQGEFDPSNFMAHSLGFILVLLFF